MNMNVYDELHAIHGYLQSKEECGMIYGLTRRNASLSSTGTLEAVLNYHVEFCFETSSDTLRQIIYPALNGLVCALCCHMEFHPAPTSWQGHPRIIWHILVYVRCPLLAQLHEDEKRRKKKKL